MAAQKDVLGVGGESTPFPIGGNCDLWVSNLTSGTITFQIKFQGETTWRDFPNGVFTTSDCKTVFLSEGGAMGKFVGSGNNADVYVRIGRLVIR